jgi:hypothetical protein
MRIVGLLGGLATALLTYRLAKEVTPAEPEAKSVAAGTAVALTMLSPLVVQSALILDIDFTILLPLTLLFLWLYARLEPTSKRWLWLAPLFALLLWAKMTNPLPLIGVIAVWQLLRGQWQRAIVHPLAIGLGGAALFAITWGGIGTLLGFPLAMPFLVNQVQWADSADVARRAYTSVGAFIDGLQPTVLWLGPGLVALGLAGVCVRVAQLAQRWQIRTIDLLIGVLIVFVLGYVNKSAGWFPKYQVALAPLLACLAAPLIARAWRRQPRLTAWAVAFGTLLSGLLTARLVGDSWALERTWRIDDTAAVWLIGCVVVVSLVGLPRRAIAATATAAIVGLAIGWSLATDARQAPAAYQTGYWYGTTGVLDAANWVDTHLAPDETYVGAKEVAIRSRDQRYVDQDNLIYFASVGRPFDRIWASEPLHALVTWQREPYVADQIARVAANLHFRETARFGDYVIYEPTDGS